MLNVFGVGGRNTGLLTYASLLFVFLGAAQLNNQTLVLKVLKGFVLAGLLNVFYCLFSILGLELLPWNNIYNTILGTFGNPNFIGAFLGIFGVITFAYFLSTRKSLLVSLSIILILIINFIEILKSHAIQGLVVFALGSSIVIWAKIRSLRGNRLVEIFYLCFVLAGGSFAVLGALQVGPLTKYIYKTSVSLRGEYWHAAWNMGLSHPLTGVGMDSYGTWYRRARDLQALVLPGVDTTSNAAHNVFLDIFAYGGFPLLIIYMAILAIIAKSAFNIFFLYKKYDFISMALVSGWICYLAQALISINQIGIAIWGWIFGGLIIAYDRVLVKENVQGTSDSPKVSGRDVNPKKTSDAGLALASIIGLVIGLIVSLPPMVADAKWRNALGSGDANKVESAALAWPQDPIRLNQAIKIFSDNKLHQTAKKLSQSSVSIFRDSFISWFSYIQLPGLTKDEYEKARRELHRLDPMNPEYK